MIPRRLISFAGIALATTAFAQAPADITADELTKLRLRLAQLEAENIALQKELDELRALSLQPDPNPPARGLSIEPQPDWVPREYRGLRYYMVPLTPAAK